MARGSVLTNVRSRHSDACLPMPERVAVGRCTQHSCDEPGCLRLPVSVCPTRDTAACGRDLRGRYRTGGVWSMTEAAITHRRIFKSAITSRKVIQELIALMMVGE